VASRRRDQLHCTFLSGVTVINALGVGIRDASGGMAAKVGGIMITVIGVLGLISCFMAE
jgi:hypothetical protein